MKIYTPKQLKEANRKKFRFTVTSGIYNPCGEIFLQEQQDFPDLYNKIFPQLEDVERIRYGFPIITNFVGQDF